MVKNSLIYRTEEGKEIKIDNTILNRMKAFSRGFKLVCKVNRGKTKDGK